MMGGKGSELDPDLSSELKEAIISQIIDAGRGDQLHSDSLTNQQSTITQLQVLIKDLESTIHLQGIQNNTLKAETTRLQSIINTMEHQASMREDKIESLKAETIKCELKSQIRNDEKNILESNNSKQEDEIETLKAEIVKLKVQSELHEKEKREAVEDAMTKMELSHLEGFE